MENILDIIKKRKSIRAYKDKPLHKDVIDSILEAAKYAPTARNLQQLEYKVITDKSLITRLSEAIEAAIKREGFPTKGSPDRKPDFFYGAPLLIIV